MSQLECFLAPIGDLNQTRRQVNIDHTVTKALANLARSGLIRGVCTPIMNTHARSPLRGKLFG